MEIEIVTHLEYSVGRYRFLFSRKFRWKMINRENYKRRINRGLAGTQWRDATIQRIKVATLAKLSLHLENPADRIFSNITVEQD